MTLVRMILLVEDNDDDAELTLMAFRQAQVSCPVVRVGDGIEALDFLFMRGSHAGRDPALMPTMVLLDLKLPRLGGLEVLKALRADQRTRFLPVIVLTSSVEYQDLLTAYELHANSYVQKPIDYHQFVTAAHQLGLYWMSLNVPAPGAAHAP